MGQVQKEDYYNMVYNNAPRYSKHYRTMPYLPTWALVLQLINNHERTVLRDSAAKVTDIGCGTGQFAHFLADHTNCVYTGLDFSEVAIEMAKARGSTNNSPAGSFTFIKTDFTDAARNKELFTGDVFTILETLEHLENDIDIVSALPKGSLVIISVPTFDDDGHVRFFSSAEEVDKRYGRLIGTIEAPAKVERIRSWFLIYGIRNGDTPMQVSL